MKYKIIAVDQDEQQLVYVKYIKKDFFLKKMEDSIHLFLGFEAVVNKK